MCVQHTGILSALCKWERQKMFVFVVTVRSTRGQKMAVRSTQGQNRAVRKRVGGVTLNIAKYESIMFLLHLEFCMPT